MVINTDLDNIIQIFRKRPIVLLTLFIALFRHMFNRPSIGIPVKHL